jgi:hypothetical protein
MSWGHHSPLWLPSSAHYYQIWPLCVLRQNSKISSIIFVYKDWLIILNWIICYIYFLFIVKFHVLRCTSSYMNLYNFLELYLLLSSYLKNVKGSWSFSPIIHSLDHKRAQVALNSKHVLLPSHSRVESISPLYIWWRRQLKVPTMEQRGYAIRS